MANIASSQAAPQTQAEYEAAFDLLMAEAEHLNTLMDSHRSEIERLKVETSALRDETHAMLARMDAEQAVQQMQWEQRHDRDMAVRDQENLILRMENSRLRAERDLPSSLF